MQIGKALLVMFSLPIIATSNYDRYSRIRDHSDCAPFGLDPTLAVSKRRPLMEPIAILGRKYSSEILAATSEPQTAGELSENLSIPVATCYRRVNELTAAGFLTEQPDKRDDGSPVSQFQRTTDAIDIRLDDSVSVYMWPRETQRSRLRTLVASPFTGFDFPDRLSWPSRSGHADSPASNLGTSQKPPESSN